MFFLYALIFIISCLILARAGAWVIQFLSRIAKFLGWKEFVVGFFMMAMATSLPNLFIGIVSALNKIPELSFGDVIGGNLFDLSLVVAIASFLSRGGLSAQSRTVQGSAFFTMAIAVLPVFLGFDGVLSRVDGVLLITMFLCYTFWIFGKRERFEKIYDGIEKVTFRAFLKDIAFFLLSVGLLILAAEGMVKSAIYFTRALNISLALVGMLIVGIGSSIPESFFSWQAARRGQDWMLLGDLMGGVIIVATLVLGAVSIIYPIHISSFFPMLLGRIFLIIAAISFFIAIRTNQKINKKEGLFLLAVYIAFLITVIFLK